MSIRKEWEEILRKVILFHAGIAIQREHDEQGLSKEEAISALAKSLRERLPKEKALAEESYGESEGLYMKHIGYNAAIKELTSILDDLERTSDAD